MEEFVKYATALVSLGTVVGGAFYKLFRESQKTNHWLEKLTLTMEHQNESLKKDINNNLSIVDNNFAILNGEFVEIKKVVFEKSHENPIPLQETKKIS